MNAGIKPDIACGNMKKLSRWIPLVTAEESGLGIAIVVRDV